MPFYEVIYETGEHSIMSGADDAEVLAGISEQHRRATMGEDGGPAGHTATRVKRVLKYDEHPGSLYESQTVPTKEVEKWFSDAIKEHQIGDLVSVPQLIASLRTGLDSLITTTAHESNYKMKEVTELDPKSWASTEAN
jgi:hypothetical protein